MALICNRPAIVYPTKEKAQEAADLLADGETEGWIYVVKVDPRGSGKAVIEVYDDDGEFAGHI